MMQIRRSTDADLASMLAIINDAAQAYRGVIPSDRWHEPYMSMDELTRRLRMALPSGWQRMQDAC